MAHIAYVHMYCTNSKTPTKRFISIQIRNKKGFIIHVIENSEEKEEEVDISYSEAHIHAHSLYVMDFFVYGFVFLLPR